MVEAVDISGSTRHLTTNTPKAVSKARYTELIANAINARAESIGMRVNCLKTQLLMISPPNGYEKTSYISINNQKIESEKRLKLLGFTFGTEPNVAAHVEEMKKKFRSRYWTLINLKRSGFVGHELLSLFNVFVRPVIEYCCTIYHPLLTGAQSDEIEKMQRQVVNWLLDGRKNIVCCVPKRIL